ncbi:Methyltransferase FkbM domain-containing protein [Thermomonospora echinospora]|uniref:Methyltransferase FkbM domain-containing protein n=1 Tax=Thermomonospora echinospora TaxID=1992 RepID=A0A1H5YJQ4_9ACTN|nr:FkbM family methyltransferase [Thermomonospora echinospora]SEG24341.1 Methyltransferase FkbM domain-containing protein [Thermomonospora echinospora]
MRHPVSGPTPGPSGYDAELRRYARPGFDLLKVDVEGREAGVLASADLAYWRPRALSVPARP